jgi:hypothetical protein
MSLSLQGYNADMIEVWGNGSLIAFERSMTLCSFPTSCNLAPQGRALGLALLMSGLCCDSTDLRDGAGDSSTGGEDLEEASIWDQADIEALAGIRELESLRIGGSGSDIRSLHGLEELARVTTLEIVANTSLQTLEGLERVSVDSLVLADNPALVRVEQGTVGAFHVEIVNNESLEDVTIGCPYVCGFGDNDQVGQSTFRTDSLDYVSSPPSQQIMPSGGDVEIRANDALQKITFSFVSTEHFRVNDNPNLETIFSDLGGFAVFGDAVVMNNESLPSDQVPFIVKNRRIGSVTVVCGNQDDDPCTRPEL